MSKARQKGTSGENFFRDLLRPIWPLIDRAPLRGVNDYGDLTNVPWLHECKSTATPKWLEWAEVCDKKSPGRWALLWKGDLRRTSRKGPYVLLPVEHYQMLAATWEHATNPTKTVVDL